MGASSTSGRTGKSPTTAPPAFSTRRPVSVTRPMTAKSTPHFSKMARASSAASGRITMSIRS